MEVSIFLAKALGLWMTIIGFALFYSPNNFKTLTHDFFENRSVVYLGGIIALCIGCLMVAGHNIWHWDWRLFITLIGWLSLFKGIFLITWPEKAKAFYQKALDNYNFKIAGFFYVIFGLVLCWIGFLRN